MIGLPDDASAAVLGAAGSGKTSTIVELVAERVNVRGWQPQQLLVLAASRASAARLRDAIAVRLAVPTTGPIARTAASFSFEVVRAAAFAADQPAPRLLTGAEQDADIAALLDGHLLDGSGPQWPDALGPEVRATRRFRTELRELLMRMTELDLDPAALRERGLQQQRPEWVAAADFAAEYTGTVAGVREHQYDSAEFAAFAARAIADRTAEAVVGPLRLVIVDDLPEVTESTLRLLRELAARGVAVLGFGDPDVAVNAFRGGRADALGRLDAELGLQGRLQQLRLSTVHRQGPALRGFSERIAEGIGAAAAGEHRRSAAGAEDAHRPLAVIEAPSPARLWAAVARELRERHLAHGRAWNELAVIVRSGAQVPAVARALAAAEVPVRTTTGRRALRDDGAARSLLRILAVALGHTELSAETAAELLLSPFGGLDALGLRRLRLALRTEELAGGGHRLGGELLAEALAAPSRLSTVDHRAARAAARLAETLELVRTTGGTAEELLWLVWQRSGLAEPWYKQALGSGLPAAEANRDLDGVLALFTAAKRFGERRPDGTPVMFLAEVLDAEVPEDTLAPRSGDDAVLVTTPPGAVGAGFDTVIIGGLQEGAWPNLRLRGSLLAPQELHRKVAPAGQSSPAQERRAVLHDELRMLALAVSRARSRVVLAAVAGEDESPSPFLRLIGPDVERITPGRPPLTLRGMVGRLRREAVAGSADAAAGLAALAAEGVPGAHPDEWHGLAEPTVTGSIFAADAVVPVSPSAIGKVEDDALNWFIETYGLSGAGLSANVGTLLHWAMEHSPDSSLDSLWAAVESRWDELDFEAPWLAERERRLARGFTAALAEYLADFEREGKTLAAAERGFALELGRAKLRGFIDRIEVSADGVVTIADLKTGRPKTSPKELAEDAQLQAYQLAYASGELDEALAGVPGHRAGGAKLVFVREGVGGKPYREGVQAALDEEGIERFLQRIREVVATVTAEDGFTGAAVVEDRGSWSRAELRLHRVRAVSSD